VTQCDLSPAEPGERVVEQARVGLRRERAGEVAFGGRLFGRKRRVRRAQRRRIAYSAPVPSLKVIARRCGDSAFGSGLPSSRIATRAASAATDGSAKVSGVKRHGSM
jgi:hypothetical protein